MEPKAFWWLVLKKLPIILAVFLLPLTLALIVHFKPSFFEFFRLTSDSPEIQNKPSGIPDRVDSNAEEPKWSNDLDRLREEEDIEDVVQRKIEVEEGDPLLEETLKLSREEMEREREACEKPEDFLRLAAAAEIAGFQDLSVSLLQEVLVMDPDNRKAHKALGHVRYDPAFHLDGFSEFLGRQLEYELKPFRKDSGEWLDSEGLARIRDLWSVAKARLKEEIERRRNDPHEELRRRHMRRLMRHDDFAKIISKGNFRIDRNHPPFLLIIERGEEEEYADQLTSNQETVALDLVHARSTLLGLYGNSGKRGSGDDKLHFVWMVKRKEGCRTRYLPEDDMLEVILTEGPEDEPPDEMQRREAVAALGRMIMDREVLGEEDSPGLWILEGLPSLLAMGEGEDEEGRLLLNGRGSRGHPAFKTWIEKNHGRWPVPLDVLVGLGDSTDLWRYCHIEVVKQFPDLKIVPKAEIFEGARTACGLFCLHLMEKSPDLFPGEVSACLEGTNTLGELLGGDSLTSIQKRMERRFLP